MACQVHPCMVEGSLPPSSQLLRLQQKVIQPVHDSAKPQQTCTCLFLGTFGKLYFSALHALFYAGAAFDIPGAARPLDFSSEEMLREFEQHQGMSENMEHFDNIFQQTRQQGRPPVGFRPPDGPQARLIEPCLQVCNQHDLL